MNIKKEKEISYIKIEKINGQAFINLICKQFKNQKIIDKRYKILKKSDYILFPLIENHELINLLITTIEKKYNFEILSMMGVININYNQKNLQDALKNLIPNRFLESIPKSYDSIGNLAIIEFNLSEELNNQELNNIKIQIAKAMMAINKCIISVFEKKSQIKGTYRLREINFLYGENKTEAIHRENNCSFKLDVKKTFFSPRLVYERNRIATSNIKKNELIIDLFAGVGPFSIQIAKNHKVKIHAFDISPYAYYYLKENLKLNKLKGEIFAYNLDVRSLLNPLNDLGKSLRNSVDRIIMNLPKNSIDFTDLVCFLMKKSGGILHIYQFCEKPDPIEKAIKIVRDQLNYFKWGIEIITASKIVKAYSPKSDLVVLDIKIKLLD
ncbi:MAG: class I SAM-dependent methyltransferase family protein [Promethearchaeota archaeon]